jgi:hypothetical protein
LVFCKDRGMVILNWFWFLSDYIAHQFEDSVEVSIILLEGTIVIQMEDGKLPDDVM